MGSDFAFRKTLIFLIMNKIKQKAIEAVAKILLVDDESIVLSSLKDVLSMNGYCVETCLNGEEGLKKIENSDFDLILTDLVMEPINGLELLEKAQINDPDSIVILMTGYATVESAVDAIRKGAYDYLLKPFQIQNLLLTIRRGVEKRRLSLENRSLIYDLKENNAKLTTALKELRKTQKKLLQSERRAAVTETVIAMKHEINNPLTAMLNKIQILQERCENQPDYLNRDLQIVLELICRISNTMKKLDNIQQPVSTIYTDGISMLDIPGSTASPSSTGGE